MKENISLKIESEYIKKKYLHTLKHTGKIPVCLNCKKLFSLGFPNSEEGISDYLICQENYLLCECEYSKMVRNLYVQKEDGLVDMTQYYKVEE